MMLSSLKFWEKSSGQKQAKVNNNSGKAKKFMSKLSGAFMLPVSIMAIAGLFLGVGAAFADHIDNEGMKVFGLFIKNLGDPIFGAMPALFMVAIVISFTDEQGSAVFSGLVAFLVFSAIQQPFINVHDVNGNYGQAEFLFINTSDDISAKMYKIVGSNLGIQSLNTSIFGGICVGLIVSWLYNKYYTIQLPAMISFFGGKRFVPIVAILAMIPLCFAFLLIWPWIGLGLAYFGEYSGKVAGLDSFIFGFVERSLIPFGLHHVFYAPLWWTSAGGDVQHSMDVWAQAGNHITAVNGLAATTIISGGGAGTLPNGIAGIDPLKAQGDSYAWLAAQSSGIQTVTYTLKDGSVHTEKLFPFIDNQLGVNLGRFMQGKFAFMQLGLPAAGAAMIMAAPKENRKLAAGVIFPACLTSFVTGVTEPIEFTFLFLAPALFWGFHAVMAAFSFLFMNLLGAHVGMTFSGGIIDTIIYGALPIAQGTNFYWMYVIGAAYAPIYYFVFYWAIKRFDLATPGRGGNVKLFTKADVKAAKEGVAKGSLTQQGSAIVAAYGGWDNIQNFQNCATRLRYDVKDINKVDESALKAAGAVGIVKVGTNHVQAIMGPVAEQINVNIKLNQGAVLEGEKPASAPVVKAEQTKVVTKAITVKSVINGTAKSLESLKDGVFSEKMLGDGVVIATSKTLKTGKYLAPVSGELVSVMPHAYGIKTEEGIEVLLHIGLDTVNLNGKGFDVKVKQGQVVKAGDLLVEVNLETIRPQVPTTDAIVVVTSMQKVTNKAEGKITTADTLFKSK